MEILGEQPTFFGLNLEPLIDGPSGQHFLLNDRILILPNMHTIFLKGSALQIVELDLLSDVFLLVDDLLQLMLLVLCEVEDLLDGTVGDMSAGV